ncbi:MAG: C45 family peptidase [Bacteroidota bacterium]
MLFVFIGILVLLGLLLILFAFAVLKFPPNVPEISQNNFVPYKVADDFYCLNNNWIKKNNYGLWEMYIEGDAYERGLMNGILASTQLYNQEKFFVAEIKKRVTNRVYLYFLKLIVAWMNRKLNHYVGPEYNQEIYGISRSASREFSFIGPSYIRILNYHAAHDIGHTLQYMNFVGCTSFAAWGKKTDDGMLLHGRNFDFHVGDEFSEEKIITFYNPKLGSKFVMITWGGMVGTVSGMNIHGIAITVNAAKSKLPMISSTPITILVREMLQYAESLEQAIAIADKCKIFVSESIHVSSGKENKSMLIEKTPYDSDIFAPDNFQLICTNHFQSEKLKNAELNLQQISESSSMKRFERMQELFNRYDKISVQTSVDILRDRLGVGDNVLGFGNEIAINQLIAHHSVVFKPGLLKMWISAGPYCLGSYICYDLNDIFHSDFDVKNKQDITVLNDWIAADAFLSNGGNRNYSRFKSIRQTLLKTKKYDEASQKLVDELIELNPDSYLAYWETGDFYKNNRMYQRAMNAYDFALSKPIPTLKEKLQIEKNKKESEKKLMN